MDPILREFASVWLVDFHFIRPPGECPRPLRLAAREINSGQTVKLELGRGGEMPPYPRAADSLFVCFDAPTQLGCHLSLGWPLPVRILDLRAEFRCLTAGLEPFASQDLTVALAFYGLAGDGIDALAQLLQAMLPSANLAHGLLRGRYTAAVAKMEAVGIPIDINRLTALRTGWEPVKEALIEEVDQAYGVFDGPKFSVPRWNAWLNENRIRWPRLPSGKPHLALKVFREMAKVNPKIRPMAQLRASLSQLRPFKLAVGSDGRNRCPLYPFASKTGRNQPSSNQFVFGPPSWVRGLIRPQPGMALAYIDYEQQEFGIAAALSQDLAMKAAYAADDPYLTFAKQAQAVPHHATKLTHPAERERFKVCALGVQYGMRARSLSIRLNIALDEAKNLIALHKATYQTYWRWSQKVGRQARRHGRLSAAFGWTLQSGPKTKPRTARNFPIQANGAEMLRLACCFLTEGGVRVCAPVHDAVLIEAPSDNIEDTVRAAQQAMAAASELVLPGFPLRTDARIVNHPSRFLTKKGEPMWTTVWRLMEQQDRTVCP